MNAEHDLDLSNKFVFSYTEEGYTYWMNVDQRLYTVSATKHRRNIMAKILNEVGDIEVPEYKEAKWMPGARYEYMCKARDGIKNAFDWNKTDQGFEYWKTA